ncbi:unnamed protein product, partial [Amoebophrya sp. A25]
LKRTAQGRGTHGVAVVVSHIDGNRQRVPLSWLLLSVCCWSFPVYRSSVLGLLSAVLALSCRKFRQDGAAGFSLTIGPTAHAGASFHLLSLAFKTLSALLRVTGHWGRAVCSR